MNELLMKLKKAVDRALDAHALTQEIGLSEFPSYVIKSLETILADADRARASSRLGILKQVVDEVLGVAKRSAGAAEDVDSQKVNVVVFEEPGLSAKRTTVSETSPAAAGGALGASAVHGPDGMLGKALQELRQEVSELKRTFGGAAGKAMHPDKDKDEDGEEDKHKATEQKQVLALPKPAVQVLTSLLESGNLSKPAATAISALLDGKDGIPEQPGPGKSLRKSVAWPLDMNMTMPGAEPVTKRDPTLDWGSEPDAGAQATRE